MHRSQGRTRSKTRGKQKYRLTRPRRERGGPEERGRKERVYDRIGRISLCPCPIQKLNIVYN